jgi:hypothetical protein
MYGEDSGVTVPQLAVQAVTSGNIPQNIEKEFKVINLIMITEEEVIFLPRPIL